MKTELHIDHEVRLRMLENQISDIKSAIIWCATLMITVIITPIILHHYGLI